MNIIEKLGITPIEMYSGSSCIIGERYCHEKAVRELEQQRNGMLEALIDLMNCDALKGYPIKDSKYSRLIEKTDPQHRSWEEIKELL